MVPRREGASPSLLILYMVPRAKEGYPILSDVTWFMSFDVHNNPMRQVLLLPAHFREEEMKVKRRNKFWSLVGRNLKSNLSDSIDHRVLWFSCAVAIICREISKIYFLKGNFIKLAYLFSFVL